MSTPEQSPSLKFRDALENDLWREVYKANAPDDSFGVAADDAVLIYRERLTTCPLASVEPIQAANDPISFDYAFVVAQNSEGTDLSDAWTAFRTSPQSHGYKKYAAWVEAVAAFAAKKAPHSKAASSAALLALATDAHGVVFRVFAQGMIALVTRGDEQYTCVWKPDGSLDLCDELQAALGLRQKTIDNEQLARRARQHSIPAE